LFLPALHAPSQTSVLNRSATRPLRFAAHKKTRREGRVHSSMPRHQKHTELFQFDFFVFHVLACLGIKFHDQHFVRRGFLVFGGRVEMTRAGS
jgi:hypothetical protein